MSDAIVAGHARNFWEGRAQAAEAEVDQLRGYARENQVEARKAWTEVERLREALRQIGSTLEQWHTYDDIRRIVRSALDEGEVDKSAPKSTKRASDLNRGHVQMTGDPLDPLGLFEAAGPTLGEDDPAALDEEDKK